MTYVCFKYFRNHFSVPGNAEKNFHLGFLPTHIGRTGGENMAVYSDLVRNEYKAYSHGFVGVNSH